MTSSRPCRAMKGAACPVSMKELSEGRFQTVSFFFCVFWKNFRKNLHDLCYNDNNYKRRRCAA